MPKCFNLLVVNKNNMPTTKKEQRIESIRTESLLNSGYRNVIALVALTLTARGVAYALKKERNNDSKKYLRWTMLALCVVLLLMAGHTNYKVYSNNKMFSESSEDYPSQECYWDWVTGVTFVILSIVLLNITIHAITGALNFWGKERPLETKDSALKAFLKQPRRVSEKKDL